MRQVHINGTSLDVYDLEGIDVVSVTYMARAIGKSDAYGLHLLKKYKISSASTTLKKERLKTFLDNNPESPWQGRARPNSLRVVSFSALQKICDGETYALVDDEAESKVDESDDGTMETEYTGPHLEIFIKLRQELLDSGKVNVKHFVKGQGLAAGIASPMSIHLMNNKIAKRVGRWELRLRNKERADFNYSALVETVETPAAEEPVNEMQRILDLQSEVDALRKRLESELEIREKMKREASASAVKIKSLQDRLKAPLEVETKVKALTGELERAKREHSALLESRNEWRAIAQDEEKAVLEWKERHDRLEKELFSIQSNAPELLVEKDSRIKELETKLQTCEMANAELQRRLDEQPTQTKSNGIEVTGAAIEVAQLAIAGAERFGIDKEQQLEWYKLFCDKQLGVKLF